MIKVRTSDRLMYRRCRRKWWWASGMQQGLVPIDGDATALWFGTGFHYALQEFHGFNKYGSAQAAFESWVTDHCSSITNQEVMELLALGKGMFDHYKTWLMRRGFFKTEWRDGVPLVEVTWEVPLDDYFGIKNVVYTGTFDRLATDEFGRLWVVEYKTCKQFNTSKLDVDTQVSAYSWAANKLFGHVEGVVYIQFMKACPQPPLMLQTGGLSQNKTQKTTYNLYRTAIDDYGLNPDKYKEMLQYLAEEETEMGDKFIRMDYVHRSRENIQHEEKMIVEEIKEMIDKKTSYYPNPTRDCAWDCQFKAPCLMVMDGIDPTDYMQTQFMKAPDQEEL